MNTELCSFDAVLFDFADTLFDSRSALLPDVMAQHSADLGMRAAPEDCERWIEQILAYVATPQGQARMQSCDYSPDLHRASWNTVVHACEGIPPAFAPPFYEAFCDAELLWRPFPDGKAVLRTLRVAGIATGIVSNIGLDILPCLAANRMTRLIDTVVQLFRAGRPKPDGEMFLAVLRNLRIEPARALMVGDNWSTNGAAAVGIHPGSTDEPCEPPAQGAGHCASYGGNQTPSARELRDTELKCDARRSSRFAAVAVESGPTVHVPIRENLENTGAPYKLKDKK